MIWSRYVTGLQPKQQQSKQLIAASKINKLLGKRDRGENVIQDQTSQLENDVFQGNIEDTSERDASSSTLPEVSPVQPNDSESNSCSDKRIAELEAKIEALKESKRNYRARVKELRQQVNDLEDKLNCASSAKAKIELVTGSGIFLKKSKVAAAKLGSHSPNILARNLFRYLFKKEEVLGHSLMGRTCNANRQSSALPSINAEKRDALVEFSLAAYNIKPSISGRGMTDEYKIHKTRILTSLTKLIREESKKASSD
ncbi:unnamed protein product [Allacma fusca]|uniref:BEN domain-containing protein n=1 Tax=Allacma fusca TaxID=39272 RepID=A0A8J2L7E3_9HEXA|nr:unnamed protein product [Allacma fusca]